MRHVIIRNCGNGAQDAPPSAITLAPDSAAGTQLTLDKVTIENSFGYGILAFAGDLKADNCLIHSCGASAIGLIQGGNYELNNCTIAIYGNNKIGHTDNPAAWITNFFSYAQGKYYSSPLNATLTNCVISGSLENEFVGDSVPDYPAQIALKNCLLKGDKSKMAVWIHQDKVLYSTLSGTSDSLFTDVPKMNYRPKAGSPLINAGVDIGITKDIDENDRKDGRPDIGCYEVQP
jgi:hypothetical protein